MKFDTETEVRDFLRLCLAPRPGMERTPAKLAEIMPGPLEPGNGGPPVRESRAARPR